MLTSDFDYELPRELIATHPAPQRDESRLLVLHPANGAMEHRQFHNLPNYLQPGDLLVMNDTRVIKARLRGTRTTTGAGVEILLLSVDASISGIPESQIAWKALCRPAKKVKTGETIVFAGGNFIATVVSEGEEGERTLMFNSSDLQTLLEHHGEIPLPPYIVQRRKEIEAEHTDTPRESLPPAGPISDAERYQTIYAREGTSVAAPTAGLHFTPQLLDAIRSKSVKIAYVTLNVGAGTFKPVEVENPAEHPIHEESFSIPEETATLIAETRAAGGRIIAVGTTTVRALESAFDSTTGNLRTGPQSTRLLIIPGYKFNVIDGLVTNFHLPRSSLLMMISALAGHQGIMTAYREAIAQKYRFYSYGDAMLILPTHPPIN